MRRGGVRADDDHHVAFVRESTGALGGLVGQLSFREVERILGVQGESLLLDLVGAALIATRLERVHGGLLVDLAPCVLENRHILRLARHFWGLGVKLSWEVSADVEL